MNEGSCNIWMPCHAMHDKALLTMKMMAVMMMMALATQQLFMVSPSIYYSLIYNFFFRFCSLFF